ncbi:NADPH oxidase organizer 1a isoform X4 [Cynoglossus semilaevis]|uniref:NADPH oxidase organizer 1a isoform X4 n=1 Tax=Cynoglossus semilaevis TaxID=244447 RepID=UPI0004975AE3|nr:NADPH oxidase organizer 1-like isoform X4 [Cynoglossus semilaevis]
MVMGSQRYPISVRLTGVMHKAKSKMFITSVLWSDQDDIIVYRTLKEFQKLHKQLKKTFPAASKLKKSDRIIPKLQVRKVKRGGRKKGHKKSLLRLKMLQKYCNKLLSCDIQVLRSADLVQFFQPTDQDLLPDFSKNSIIVMISEDDVSKGTGHTNGGNITSPFVTETYRCVAAYETKDIKNKPFKVAKDEKMDVLIKDKGGWWLVEKEDKRMAWFPAPYLEKLDEEEEDDEDGILDRGTLFTAIRNYTSTKEDEISVNMGGTVEVLQKSSNGWWFIRYNGKAGYVPSMYLKPYNPPQIRTIFHHSRPASSLFPAPPSMSHQLSHSQGNLLQLPSSSSPLLHPNTKLMSRSLDVLTVQTPVLPVHSTSATTTPTPPTHIRHPPTIMVEGDEEEHQNDHIIRSESQASSLTSSSEFSLSDDLSSSTASSTFNLNRSTNHELLRLSRTPPPTSHNSLSPNNGTMGNMVHGTSDPGLFQRPTSPRVPPRPQTEEILRRCTTVTRKNIMRDTPCPTPPEVMSQ